MERRDLLKMIGLAPVVGLPAVIKPPTVVAFPSQPMPSHLHMAWTKVGGTTVTSIMRTWKPGDVERCKLCPLGQCIARQSGVNHCLVVVSEHVKPGLPASLYSVTDLLKRRADH
jgi:hypothetical protein